ncbi:Probable glucuronokinase 2 [Durusdinium trenchii]|uniref:Probable glucuronokinase 2 n=1 Tax=Durusdinium trenchii TaxID=1381693 RepID=A0ABP0Q9S4_9DINO
MYLGAFEISFLDIMQEEWCANVTLARPDLVALDYNHELLMNVLGIDGLLDGPWSEEFGQPPGSIGVEHEVSTPVIRNRLTGSRPMILHFPGRAKLSRYRPCPQEPGSHCQLSLPFEVMRLLMPEAYSGWRLKALQDVLDDLSHPWLLRHPMSPYNLHFQKLQEIVDKLKRRDHLITLILAGDLILLAAAVLFLALSRGFGSPFGRAKKESALPRLGTKEMGDGAAVNRMYEGAICIVLAAGFSKVEKELEEANEDDLAGLPKALLPMGGKPMLDHWWEYLFQNRLISDIFLVSNALKYKHFERWATAKGIAVSRVVNSGATAVEKGRGVLRDVELGLRRAQQVLGPIDSRDMVVFAGDTLFFKDFDLQRILDFHFYKGGSLMLYYGCREVDHPSERGMCEVDETSKVISFVEKPAANQRGFDFAFVSPLFYILEPKAWKKIPDYNSTLSRSISSSSGISFSFGRFVQHAIEDLKLPFWGMRMPGAFHLIGASTGLEEYRQLDRTFSSVSSQDGFGRRLRTKTYARVGLMGNPSDGFHGKTLSVTIRNFWASAEIWESQQLRLLPHPLFDPSSFSGLADLHFIGRREGYYGGTRLLMATCKRFQELCTSRGIALPSKNFTLRYDTNIPRQVGLAGSSAIVNSVFQALMKFFNLSEELFDVNTSSSCAAGWSDFGLVSV